MNNLLKIRNFMLLVMVGGLLTISIAFTFFHYQVQRNALQAGIDRELLTAAIMARDVLPVNYHERVSGKDSISDAEYLQVVERFNLICKQTGMEYLWSLILRDGKIEFTSATSPGKDASKRDQAGFLDVHSNPELYTHTFDTMQPQFQINEDRWGRIRVVLVPFIDTQGRKYLLGASRSMQEVDQQLQNLLTSTLLLDGGLLGLGTLICFLLANSFARSFDELSIFASKIAAGDYTSQFYFPARSFIYHEVTSLARSLERMKQAVQIREDALRKGKEQYRLLTENVKDVVWILDSETLFFRYVSPSVERLRGYTPDEILAEPVTKALTPEAAEYLIHLIHDRAEDFRTGKHPDGIFYTDEVEQPCKDGTTVWTEVITNYYLNLETNRVEVRGVTRDTTERKRAEEKIQAAQVELQRLLDEAEHSRQSLLSMIEDQKAAEEQIRRLNRELEQRVRDRTALLTTANQELEAFAYSVSHDLRAPLRSLDGFSTILLADYADQLNEQGRHYLNRIQEASRRMGQLINDLLNLSRVTRVEFFRQQVDISVLAQGIASSLKTQAPHRQVEFEIATPMIVYGDANLIKIALQNLMDNAFKFTSQRDQAIIQTGMIEQAGERVFFVRDNGAGFNMEYASKLFTPFQRLHGAQEFPGTGIGLSIVQRIISRHGGRIWPESEIGRGTTFYFTLKGAE